MNFQFESFSDFLNMGGYALFVWVSYALFLLFILGNVVPPLLSKKKILKQLIARSQREENSHESAS